MIGKIQSKGNLLKTFLSLDSAGCFFKLVTLETFVSGGITGILGENIICCVAWLSCCKMFSIPASCPLDANNNPWQLTCLHTCPHTPSKKHCSLWLRVLIDHKQIRKKVYALEKRKGKCKVLLGNL